MPPTPKLGPTYKALHTQYEEHVAHVAAMHADVRSERLMHAENRHLANRQTIQSFDREEQQVYTALLDFKPVGQFKLRDRVVVPFLPWSRKEASTINRERAVLMFPADVVHPCKDGDAVILYTVADKNGAPNRIIQADWVPGGMDLRKADTEEIEKLRKPLRGISWQIVPEPKEAFDHFVKTVMISTGHWPYQGNPGSGVDGIWSLGQCHLKTHLFASAIVKLAKNGGTTITHSFPYTFAGSPYHAPPGWQPKATRGGHKVATKDGPISKAEAYAREINSGIRITIRDSGVKAGEFFRPYVTLDAASDKLIILFWVVRANGSEKPLKRPKDNKPYSMDLTSALCKSPAFRAIIQGGLKDGSIPRPSRSYQLHGNKDDPDDLIQGTGNKVMGTSGKAKTILDLFKKQQS